MRLAYLLLAALPLLAQTPARPTPATAPQKGAAQTGANRKAPAGAAAGKGGFFLHAFHKEKFGGELECSMCHVAVKAGSVTLKRPGHDQCMTCHEDDFKKDIKQAVCAECHTAFPPGGAADLKPFPQYKGGGAVLFQFSHAQHVDKKERLDAKTGFRADCTFCHKFDAQGTFGTFPGHEQCATCHSKAGAVPQLNADLPAAGCRGCHSPEEVENPVFTEKRQLTGVRTVRGKYVDIAFSHVAHFKVKDDFGLKCTTCHYAIPASTSIRELSLPKMIDCVQCHDSTRAIKAEFRMSNCKTCHRDTVVALAVPAGHTRNVKPDFHNEVFRRQHGAEASAPNAKCFVCHQNVVASVEAKAQCQGCHNVMLPVNHTARWKNDLHGPYAAIDRQACAVCHTAAYCSDCHNQLPRSHAPLNTFKAGGHAVPAMLNTRSCFTCHTFQNTCQECHLNRLVQSVIPAGATVAK